MMLRLLYSPDQKAALPERKKEGQDKKFRDPKQDHGIFHQRLFARCVLHNNYSGIFTVNSLKLAGVLGSNQIAIPPSG